MMQFMILLLFIIVLFQGNMSIEYTRTALFLWFECLIPSLFIPLVCTRLLYAYNIFRYLPTKFLSKLLHMNTNAVHLFICSIFIGVPTSTQFIQEHYKNKETSLFDLQRFIYCCCMITPGFIILTIGAQYFDSIYIGFKLCIIQILSCMTELLITRKQPISIQKKKTDHSINLFSSLHHSIIQSGYTLFMIGGYILLISCCTSIISSYLPYPLNILSKIPCEFASGIITILQLDLPIIYQQYFTCILLSFSGFCVHFQVFSFIQGIPLSYKKYFFYRVLQMILSSIYFYILFILF